MKLGEAIGVFVDVARARKVRPIFEAVDDFDDVPSTAPRFNLKAERAPMSHELPVIGRISSHFGERWGRMHGGMDIAAPIGTPVRAPHDGVVVFAGWRGAYGKAIILDHGSGRQTLYGHLSRIDVNVGDAITAGMQIGAVGSTGRSTGPHCHFERRIYGRRVDPRRGWGG